VGLLNRLFGYRWSLYLVRDGRQVAYAMHEHSVIGMVGYVMGYFADGGKPVSPWCLVLNFNHSHRTITLRPEHFTHDGKNLTPALLTEIEAIDPGWRVKGAEPIFEEAATKKRLKISDHIPGRVDIQAMLDAIDKPREPTFYSVMGEVFGTT
jgi:hypothetical protein